MPRSKKPLLFTIGYQAITPTHLVAVQKQLNAVVIDVRYKPYSRRAEFNAKALAELLGENYETHGHHLGGFGHTTDEGVAFLKGLKRNALLMCMEEAPGSCHRHFAICAVHFPKAIHICRDEMFHALSLEKALTHDSEYDITDSLSTYTLP